MRNRDHSVDCNTDHVRRVTYHRKADEPMSAPRLDRLPTFRAFVSSLSSHCDPPGRRHFVQRVKAGLFTADVRDHEQLKAAVVRTLTIEGTLTPGKDAKAAVPLELQDYTRRGILHG